MRAFAFDHPTPPAVTASTQEHLVPHTPRYWAGGNRSARIPPWGHAMASPVIGSSRWIHRTWAGLRAS